MNKQLKQTGNTDKKNYIVSALEKKYEAREDVTLKQAHDNDFDLKLGSRSIVRIVANKKAESNGIALFRIANNEKVLKEVKELESVKGYTNCYSIDEIGRTESCFYRFNYETVGTAVNSALAIFDYIDNMIREKKASEEKKQESKKADGKKEESKKQESKKEEKKADGKKKQETETKKKQDGKKNSKK